MRITQRPSTCASSIFCCHSLHTSLSLATSLPSVSKKMEFSNLESKASTPVSSMMFSNMDISVYGEQENCRWEHWRSGWLATLAAQVTWALLGMQRFWTEQEMPCKG